MLKSKLLKRNKAYILTFTLLFSIASFIIIYIVLQKTYQSEIKAFAKNYTYSQKLIIKNQVYQFISYIKDTRKFVKNKMLEKMKIRILIIKDLLEKSDPKNYAKLIKKISEDQPYVQVALSDGIKPIISDKNCSAKTRIKILKQLQKSHKNYIISNKKTKNGMKYSVHTLINGRYLLTLYVYDYQLDAIAKKIIIDRADKLKYGKDGSGYIVISKILNYKGGKHFAKVLSLRIKPSWVGKYISDEKKDAKGNYYRKEYIKLFPVGEGYISYYFYKHKGDKKAYPKISFFKIYKPFDWLILTGVYLDEIEHNVKNTAIKIKKELTEIFMYYLLLLLIFLSIAYFLVQIENSNIKKLANMYEKEIEQKNEELQKINKSLELEVKRKTDKLMQHLFTDRLTSLPNRAKFLQDSIYKYIAIINIDSFSDINDFYGVDMGDKLLIEVGKFLSKYAKVYKLQADEYGIIGDSREDLKIVCKNIFSKIVSKHFFINKEKINITIKIGIAQTISNVDLALKYAKQQNKPIVVYDKNLPILKEIKNNIRWKNIIIHAIQNNKIIPYVQPIINNTTKKIEKYECLARLENDKEIHSPLFFFEVAKKTYLYIEIQKNMIVKCFKKFSNLPYSLSINLSMLDFNNENFMNFLFDNIKKYNMQNRLIVELLEDEIINSENISSHLKYFKNLGVRIAIDDFGSGYSNFIYLKKLDIDILKIDGNLIKNIDDPKINLLVTKIVEISKVFGFESIGEFVENNHIASKVIKLGIDCSQGYYYGKPFDISKLK